MGTSTPTETNSQRAVARAPLVLRTGGRLFAIHCACERTKALLHSVFAAMVRPAEDGPPPARSYTVAGPDPSGRFVLSDGSTSRSAQGLDDLVYQLDKAITVALQLERPGLFFLHAAAVAVNGRAVALPASAGTGKSTLTLALTEHGLDYLSDELAPVDLATLKVEPYPHAICLKSPPPPPYELPEGTVHMNRRLHVPVERLNGATRAEPLPLAAVVFLRRGDTRFEGLRPLSNASSATYLMAHLLNGLAHRAYGLDSAISLSETVPCYELDVTDLPAAVQTIAAL